MKLYSYIVKKDLGLAPNPFWGYCTLAVCTPNHMDIKAQKDDWIIGTSPISQGSKLVYAMQISERLSFNEYYTDDRFAKKKPNINGTWRERCGDNMYYKDQQGKWVQHRTIYHHETEIREQDLRHPIVFVAESYYYFGDNAETIPIEYQDLVWKHEGCKKDHAPNVVENFLTWLKTNYTPGIYGNPKDNDEAHKAYCL